jgi:hypothetical protein
VICQSRAVFEIHIHLKDKPLLEEIQTTLGGVGKITITDNKVSLKIYYRDLAILLDQLSNYPLMRHAIKSKLILNYLKKLWI